MTRTFVGLFYLSGCSLAKALLKNAKGTGTQELVFASAVRSAGFCGPGTCSIVGNPRIGVEKGRATAGHGCA